MTILFTLTGALLLFWAPPNSSPDASDSWQGTWQAQDDKSHEITIERTGDSVHVREEDGGKVRADYTCALNAHECEFKEDGHKAKVTLWENGPRLVEVRARGGTTTRRRLSTADDGRTLQVEVLAMEPPGKSVNMVFSRKQ